jgi:hypothetical protein
VTDLENFERDLINKVETKVKASATAAAVTTAIVAPLGLYVLHGAVPDWITAGIGTVVTAGLTFFAGWLAKHTSRPGDNPPPAAE